jgi:hypothetical protein
MLRKRYLAGGILVIAAGLSLRGLLAQQVTRPSEVPPPVKKVDIAGTYTPSGFMGDGESGTKYVQFSESCKDNPKSPPTCIKITYTPGPTQWAGMYWQNKPNNWGEKPGNDLTKSGYTKITFWARGDKGEEVVEFKTGGIDATDKGKPYKDSFEKTMGKILLEKTWKQYTISLEGLNLSSVIGAFCWVVSTSANPEGVTIYLDDIQFE